MDNKGKTVIRPNSNGYVPQPLDTKDIELSDNIALLAERLANNFHDVWGRKRVGEGWAYGPERDDAKKTNPCMVYYDELTEEQKQDDRDSAIGALKFIASKGYTIEERKQPSMKQIKKLAWNDYGRSDDKLNFDATVFIGLFGTDRYADTSRLEAGVREFCISVHDMFGQKYAARSKRGAENAPTRFAFLSPLETESERLASKIAAGYGIATYKVESGAVTDEQKKIIGVQGSAVDAICDYSLFALAVWDGIRGKSGDERMNAIIERALKGSSDRLMELDMPDNITVFHLLTPENGRDPGSSKHKAYTVRALHPYPLETGRAWFYRGGISKAKKTDRYNRERFERNVGKIAGFNAKVKKRYSAVMNTQAVHDLLPGLHGHTSTDRDLLRHLYTDLVSYAAQKKRDRQTKWMMVTAVLGLGAYSLMSDAPDKMFGASMNSAVVLSVLFVAALTAAMILFFLQKKSGSHSEYVDFRLISECLRVQTYWRAAGMKDSVEDEFGAKSKLDFEWARYIMRSWELSDTLYAPKSREYADDIVFEIAKRWYGREDEFTGGEYRHEKTGGVDQYGFSRNKAEQSFKKAARENVVRVASIAAAYGLTVLVGLIVIAGSLIGGQTGLVDYIALAASLVQIAVAGYHLYAGTKDYERLANNNNWLSIEYQKAIMACKRTADKQEQRRIFRHVGCEAVREVCGWALEFSRNEPGSPIS